VAASAIRIRSAPARPRGASRSRAQAGSCSRRDQPRLSRHVGRGTAGGAAFIAKGTYPRAAKRTTPGPGRAWPKCDTAILGVRSLTPVMGSGNDAKALAEGQRAARGPRRRRRVCRSRVRRAGCRDGPGTSV
jgi:hypothetical protein